MIFIVFMVKDKNIRASLVGLIKAAFNKLFMIIIFLLGSYTYSIIYILNKVELWDISLIKDAFIWFIFSEIMIVFKSINGHKKSHYFRGIIINNFKLSIIMEFLINEYTYNLFIEFILIPIIMLVAVMSVIVENSSEYNDGVKKLTTYIQSILGILRIDNSIKLSILDIKNLTSYISMKKFLLPIILSIFMIIPVYCLVSYSSYEQVLIRLSFYKQRQRKLTWYLKMRFMLYCKLNLKKVNKLWNERSREIIYASNKREVDNIFNISYKN